MGDKPLFRPNTQNKKAHSWFDRSIVQHMDQFIPDEDDFTIFVSPEALADLRRGTAQFAPNEAYGHLMGRVYEDSFGPFVIVAGAVYARQLKSSISHVRLSAEEMDILRKEARMRYPIADFIGWTHSHSDLSFYSSVDLEEQQTWTDSCNIGILTFMKVHPNQPGAIAYRGPKSRLLQSGASFFQWMQYDTREENPAEGSLPAPTKEADNVNRPMTSSIASNLSPSLRKIFYGEMIWLALITLVLCVMFFTLYGNMQTLLQQTTKGRVGSSTGAANLVTANTALLWNCNIQQGKAPLRVICNGPFGANIKGWNWDFGDQSPPATTSSVIHTYKTPGTYVLSLKIVVSSEEISIGALEITVTDQGSPISG